MNKNVIIRGIGAVVLLLSVGGCNETVRGTYITPNLQEIVYYKGDVVTPATLDTFLANEGDLQLGTVTREYIARKDGYWYDSDAYGNLTSDGKAKYQEHLDQAKSGKDNM